ncbi:MAG: hypothetical protein RBR49_07405 [Desulfovibrio desulfuricans]|nr:hypothetical protein [Desulfovibrio desulfuricans]
MNIEDVVNSTAKAMLDFWLRHWPICLLTLCAVLDFLDNNDSVSRIIFAASFVATVVCLKAFRLERCFWIYVLVFIGIIAFFFADIESDELQNALHLETFNENLVSRVVEAVLWTGIVALLSSGMYFLRFSHTVSPAALIKIPLTVFFMYVFLQPIFILIWYILVMYSYGILGIPE